MPKGSLSNMKMIRRCQKQRPLPAQLAMTDISIKISHEMCVWNTEVPFDETPPVVTLSPLSRIIRVPECR